MKNTLAENLLRFGVKNLSESEMKNLQEQIEPAKTTTYHPFKTSRSFTFKDKISYEKFSLEMNSYSGGVRLMEAAAFQYEDRWKMFGPYFMEMKEEVPGRKSPSNKIDLESRIQILTNAISVLAAMMGVTDLVKSFPSLEIYSKQAVTYRAMNSELFGQGTGPESPLDDPGFDKLKGQYWINFLEKIAQPLFNRNYKTYVVPPTQPQSPIAPATKN